MKTALVLFADGSEELEAVTIVNILRRGGGERQLRGLELRLIARQSRHVVTPRPDAG